MAQRQTIAVKGYREFLRACDRAEKDAKKEVRATLREVGDVVKVDWAHRYRPSDSRSAAGLRTVVRQRGVSVEQSLRKTTGQHPEWGSWQMRHGAIPALEAQEANVERKLEHAVDLVADVFEFKSY